MMGESKVSAIESLGNFLSRVIEFVVLVAGTVSLVLLTDYLLIKYYFEPVSTLTFVNTLIMVAVFEGIAFILIGIRFLSKRVEQSREGWVHDATGLIPVFYALPWK